MAQSAYIGEIFAFPYSFPPRGYVFCQGQLMSISQNAALFSLLGTTYGGNGTSNFGLPDLRGRTPITSGQGPGLSDFVLGEVDGVEVVTLIQNQMASHNHPALGLTQGRGTQPSTPSPANAAWIGSSDTPYSAGPGATVSMSPNALSFAGGNSPHNNLQPFQVINYCIATQGIYPSRN
jgi:microcystin-dependent protein